ncbi:MAG: hypothetical protein E4H27_02645 [Anaerolineales bacterium]|nr:MAG: hypothetical protein E4H27_02645 [Anaerolineales bacterium]
MNPFLDHRHYVPDAEAHIWQDGRLYLYGSYDLRGAESYCSRQYRTFSTDDMVHWTDHGISLDTQQIPWLNPSIPLYAPDCAFKDGKYYLSISAPSTESGGKGWQSAHRRTAHL